MSASEEHLRDAYAHCGGFLRDHDRDLWLAALFVAPEVRAHVHALYAFATEIARTSDIVTQPTLGEIRLQWWREVLEGERRGEGASHPVAAALLDTMARFHLPASALVAYVEARRFDLYADPMPTLGDLEGWCGEVWSALFRMASIIAAGGRDPGGAEAAGHAGVAFGLARILRDLPRHGARGQCYTPRDVLERHGAVVEAAAAGVSSPAFLGALAELRDVARRHLADARAGLDALPEDVRRVFLPLALVEPLLARMERRSYDPFASDVEPPQWRRQFSLWRAARAG